ncbi:MAG TPA: ABC transporter permease [Candidatus Sulfotelmatobacter sp.]|nr:ABC transporter permease [Candidatus Sulfotelmatobacter sp.]
MTEIVQDVRYALRQLRKNPGFTIVAVLTLALGIGANTAIFSVIETVMLNPLPFRSAGKLIWLSGKMPQSDEGYVSPADFLDYRTANRRFEQIVAYSPFDQAGPSSLSGDKPEQVIANLASANFFDTLGVPVLLGRDFQDSDEQVKSPQVAILGHGIWKRDFGSDRNVIGRTIRLDGETLQIVGVLSDDVPLLSEAEIWRPMPVLGAFMHLRDEHSLKLIGRLNSGVSMQQAQSNLDATAAQLAREYPDIDTGWSIRQRPIGEVLIGPIRPALLLIWAAAGLLLLIACANMANLVLTRSVRRQREFAVRTVLGATRRRLAWQTLTELTVLGLAGGALGALIAGCAIYALRLFGPSGVPRLHEIHLDLPVLAFALGLSVLTGAVLAIFPTLQVFRAGFTERLKESVRVSGSVSHSRLRGALVIGEIAMSLSLLIGAGLLIRSFWLLIHVNPGFQTEHVFTAGLTLNSSAYKDPQRRVRFWQELEQRIAGLPGVEAVGATSQLPMTDQPGDEPFRIPGRVYAPSEFDDAYFSQVTPGYLAAMRVPLLTGRWFDVRDMNPDSPRTVLVNEVFAKRFFPGQNVLGQRFLGVGESQPREIVGVVGNFKRATLKESLQPEMYCAYADFGPPQFLVVRARASTSSMAAALPQILGAIDKEESLSAIRSMDEIVESSVSQPRFLSLLVGTFAALALLLAGIGLYGVMAYSVSQRTSEIGIRMALGAKRKDVLAMVVLQGMKLAIAGIAVGLTSSFLLTRLLSGVLYQVKPADPLTFVLVPIGLAGVAMLANYIPARRAAKVDPMVALRCE